jgi:hypothetical protein
MFKTVATAIAPEQGASISTGGAREAVVPVVGAPARLSGALAAVAAVAAALTCFVPGVLRGPAVMNGSARGTALVVLCLAVPILAQSVPSVVRAADEAPR